MKLKSLLFKIIPESGLKNRIRCFFYNRSQNIFKLTYSQHIFKAQFEDFDLKFDRNIYYSLLTDRDYLIHRQINPGDTIIDGGAFLGSFTLLAAKLTGPEGLVIAFEPDPSNAATLKRHVKLNDIQNVVIIEKGLWSSETVLHFEANKLLASKFTQGDEAPGGLKIPVTSLDIVLQEKTVRNLFIKMNVEGSEMEALIGAKQTVLNHKPYFIIRTDHYVNGEQTFHAVEKILDGYGYQTETKQLYDITTYTTN